MPEVIDQHRLRRKLIHRARRAKPLFYARWQPSGAGAVKPGLTLDLVPTGNAGEVRAYFRGQPLGGVKATLRTPEETEHELTADTDGFLRFKVCEAGPCLLTIAHHRESSGSVWFMAPIHVGSLEVFPPHEPDEAKHRMI